VKVLFIGEGPHDIGDSSLNPDQPRPARGVIPTLARRVCGGIAPESIALAWREISRFSGSTQQRGFPGKVAAAALLAVRRFNCGATVAVADRDREDSRRAELEEGVNCARRLFPRHPAVWGLAVESVEAWTLGVPDKIAEELAVDVALVQNEYPRGIDVESMFQQSGKVEHRPKQLLERIARLKHREVSTEFRESIAEKTDPDALARACPQGFAPFADRLQRALSQA
jgi:DNA-binding transcriptional regulator of glucitol operon